MRLLDILDPGKLGKSEKMVFLGAKNRLFWYILLFFGIFWILDPGKLGKLDYFGSFVSIISV